jgi:hypothetical protein
VLPVGYELRSVEMDSEGGQACKLLLLQRTLFEAKVYSHFRLNSTPPERTWQRDKPCFQLKYHSVHEPAGRGWGAPRMRGITGAARPCRESHTRESDGN